MPRKRLTPTAVSRTKPPPTGRIELWDSQVPGLHLRISSGGNRSFAVMGRVHGRQFRYTLGGYPHDEHGLRKARRAARDVLDMAQQGVDPREARRHAQRQRQPDTIDDAVEEFIERYVRKHNRPRSAAETERALRKYALAEWSGRALKDITRRDVIDLVDGIAFSKPVTGNRVLAAVRKFFNWCLEKDKLEASPAANVKAPTQEKDRDRVLSDAEIKRVWEATRKLSHPWEGFVQMLMVTAQRRNEVANMRWSDIDLDAKLWTIPRDITKADRTHEVPLSDLAIGILDAMPRDHGHVFASGRRGDKPPSGYGKPKADLDRHAKVTGWRLHDLRRTAGTNMAKNGVPVFVIGRVLNHAESGVTRIYARASYLDEKRHALNVWADKLRSLIEPESSKVVRMRAK